MAKAFYRNLVLLVLLFLPTALNQLNQECTRKRDVKGSRRFPIVQTNNKTINTINGSASVHLKSAVTTVLLPCLYLLVFTIGLPANALALWVLLTRIKKLPSTVFLMNLAFTDLLLMLALPFRVTYYLLGNDWPFGELMCKACTALFYGNVYCSILFLTCTSVDRYLAVVHPFLSKAVRKTSSAYYVSATVWVLVILLLLPYYINQQAYFIQHLNITTCTDALPQEDLVGYFFYYTVCQVVFGFVIPCLITVFCYMSVIATLVLSGKQYAHAVKVTLLVLLVFLLCLTPFQMTLIVQSHTLSSDTYSYVMLCRVLSTLNNCIDPFIYYYISEEFRDKLRSAISTLKNETSSGKSGQSLLQSSSASEPGHQPAQLSPQINEKLLGNFPVRPDQCAGLI
ncbi:proteinase-activated receptor 2-like isoform X2 [Stegostoma tigrinum]|uniref:proteinase-activated receptor 2-like isoform X2 n=1 Tax=Stegostoma tigrinum TaxID=3053191 RepID=UPI00287071D4|nr:proteinase-activated receptor 2-like isoform X2 [Stegostoma tigrinum]